MKKSNKSKKYYDLMKVVDPHQHMPKEIANHFIQGFRHEEKSNDSFVRWTVGDFKSEYESFLLEEAAREEEAEEAEEYEEELEYEEEFDVDGSDDYDENLPRLAKVDEFLLKHFDKGEEIIILYWW